jgi:ankyrin repeat protein
MEYQNAKKQTPFEYALTNEKYHDSAKVLLEHGAHVNLRKIFDGNPIETLMTLSSSVKKNQDQTSLDILFNHKFGLSPFDWSNNLKVFFQKFFTSNHNYNVG